jgi:hypothetical protein
MDATRRRFEIGRKVLLGVLVSMALFGLSMTVLDNRAVPGPLHGAINASIWGHAELPADVELYHRFVHAVLGATIAAWALALVFVVRHALAARQRWAWWCVAASTLLWFVPDTAASLWLGVWPNALFNVACLAGLGIPLALTRGGRLNEPD